MRNFEGVFFTGEEIKVIGSDRGIDGWRIVGHGFPVGEELVESSGLKAVTAEYMISDLCSFFDETYIDGLIVLSLFLFEFDGGCQASNTPSDDNDVILHLFAGR